MLNEFDRLVVFDTETTGLEFQKDLIIELGAVAVEEGREVGSMNALIRLPEGRKVPPFVVDLTGITDQRLEAEGVPEAEAASEFAALFSGAERPLVIAYNAQFDLNFLYYMLSRYEKAALLQKCRFLDALTVYRDRQDYPHRLSNAIEAYHLQDEAVNSHRAMDDARAALRLLEKMSEEKDDLSRYINLFGVHPKYGMEGRKIQSVTYRRQPYRRDLPLYDRT